MCGYEALRVKCIMQDIPGNPCDDCPNGIDCWADITRREACELINKWEHEAYLSIVNS